MTVQDQIHQTLSMSLKPSHLDVINESGMHNVPKGSETHFKVIAVSDRFDGKTLVLRHRMINELLADQLASGVHALSMQTMTPDEWQATSGATYDSPLCRGGSKHDPHF